MAHLSTGEVGGVGISLAVMYPDVSGLSTKKRNDKGDGWMQMTWISLMMAVSLLPGKLNQFGGGYGSNNK